MTQFFFQIGLISHCPLPTYFNVSHEYGSSIEPDWVMSVGISKCKWSGLETYILFLKRIIALYEWFLKENLSLYGIKKYWKFCGRHYPVAPVFYLCIMHEDAPKMSVAHSIVASTSQAKSEIDLEVPMEYVNSTESKPSQSIEMELKISYVDTNSGKFTMLYLINYNYRWWKFL